MNLDLLTRVIGEILTAKYGKTVKVELVNVASKNQGEASAGRSETNESGTVL